MKISKERNPLRIVFLHSLALAGVCGLSCGPLEIARADTVVGGTIISADMRWSVDQSPYIVSGQVTISKGASLIVDPGVKVIFQKGSIVVDGSLKALGGVSASGTIDISSDPSAVSSGDPLIQEMGGDVLLSHSFISANRPLVAGFASSSFSIVDSGISHIENKATFISIYDHSFLRMRGVSVDSAQVPVFGDIFNRSIADISGSHFSNAGTQAVFDIYDSYMPDNAGGAQSGTRGTFHGDVFDGGKGHGIETYDKAQLDLTDSTIKNYQIAGLSFYADGIGDVSRAQFSGNATDIESYGGSAGVTQSNFDIDASALNADRYAITAYGRSSDGSGVTARNDWWGDPSGPQANSDLNGKGGKVTDIVDVSPWLTSPMDFSEHPPCCSNILFIPGVEGSRLYKNENGRENQLWEPNRNADVKKLFLNPDGTAKDASIYTKDIIGRTNLLGGGFFDQSIYDGLEGALDRLVASGTISKWLPAPYDWRFDASTTADSLALEQMAEDLASSSKTHKATIVAHSNGGLVAKALVSKLERDGKAGLIDQLVLAAVPEYGTPLTLASMLHGDGQAIGFGFVLSKQTARGLSQYMPTAYALLPSEKFMNGIIGPAITFAQNMAWPAIGTYDALSKFLSGEDGSRSSADANMKVNGLLNADNTNWPLVLSSKLLDGAKTLHQVLDHWTAPQGIQVTSIIGMNEGTMSGLLYSLPPCTDRDHIFKNAQNYSGIMGAFYPTCSLGIANRAPQFTTSGDGTVLAGDLSGRTGKVYTVDLKDMNATLNQNYQHQNILNSPAVLSLLNEILEHGQDIDPTALRIPEFVTPAAGLSSHGTASSTSSAPPPPFSSPNLASSTAGDHTYAYTVHSPVTILATDDQARQTGLLTLLSSAGNASDAEDDIQPVVQNIPNSSYIDIGETKTVVLSRPAKKIEMVGIDVGSFMLTTSDSVAGTIVASTTFSDVPTVNGEVASLEPAATSSLVIDQNGDGSADIIVPPDDPTISSPTSPPSGTIDQKNIRLLKNLNRALQEIDRLSRLIASSSISLADKNDHLKKLANIKILLQKSSFTDALTILSDMVNSSSRSVKDSIKKRGVEYSRKYLKDDRSLYSRLYLLRNALMRMETLTR